MYLIKKILFKPIKELIKKKKIPYNFNIDF